MVVGALVFWTVLLLFVTAADRKVHVYDRAKLRLVNGPHSTLTYLGLLVAGAWTDTGWPANIESALVSARRCAEAITKTPG